MDFDRVIERRGTGSTKWERYPADVLPLWVADMDFASPAAVTEALRARVEHGVYGYARVPDSLVEAVRAHLLDSHGWAIEPEWLVFLPGAVPGLNLACRAIGGPGDAVMVITPIYPPFRSAPAFQQRRLISVPAAVSGGRWQLPLEAMEAAVTPDTRVLLFCHPHNPLGRVWSAAEIAPVVEFCRRHDLVLCSDEIHCDLILDDMPHVPAADAWPDAAARTITIMSPSKTYNIPGLQFAYAVVPDPELRRRYRHAGDGFMESDYPGWFAIAGAEAAYRGGAAGHVELLDYLRGNRDLLESFVAERWPRVQPRTSRRPTWPGSTCATSACPIRCRRARRQGGALDGAAFGVLLRVNFGCPRSTLAEALRRLEDVLR